MSIEALEQVEHRLTQQEFDMTEYRLAQAEADIKALAESVEKLLGVVGQLKEAQAETLAVLRQLLSRG